MSYLQVNQLAGWTGSNPATNWPLYAKALKSGSAKGGDKAVGVQLTSGRPGTGGVVSGYAGGCLAPDGRIYFAPYGQGSSSSWHFIDTKKGVVGTYVPTGITAPGADAYRGCALDQAGRVWFIPHGQSDVNLWHYIDTRESGSSGTTLIKTIVPSITSQNNGYLHGVFVPEKKRVYMAPFAQSNQSNWHYIDTNTASVTAYTAPASGLVANGYFGAVLAPNNRVYFVPYAQANQTNWHYIDLSTNLPVAYAHGASVVANGYSHGVLAADGKIYLMPSAQAPQTNWHYIDTNTGSVVAYAHGISGLSTTSFNGGVLAPDGKIYLVPYDATGSTLYYIDTLTGTVGSYSFVAFTSGTGSSSTAYEGGILAPDNRIYLIPFGQYEKAQWHYIQTNANEKWSLNIHMCPVYNH